PYSPPVSSLLPLNRKLTPPAFPVLTMISFRPRTVRSLPASKGSDAVVLPSAEIEIQDSSRAWMTRVNSPGSAVAEFGDVLGATVGAGCAGWRLSVEKLVFRELVVGAVSAAELDGSELVAPASPGVEPPPLDEGAVVVVGVGWADSLARSRW